MNAAEISSELRAAAKKLRRLADAATPGPWECFGDHLVWPSEKGPAANDPILAMVGEAHADSAEYISSVDPAFGAAVADMLDAGADEIDAKVKRYGLDVIDKGNTALHALRAVAQTYLRSES